MIDGAAPEPDHRPADGTQLIRLAPTDTTNPGSPSRWTRAFSDVSLQITLIGLVSYGFARFAIDSYLARFDLLPGDIGLGYAETVTPVAFLAFALFAIGTAATLLLRLVPRRRFSAGIRRRLVIYTGGGLVFIVGAVTTYLTFDASERLQPWLQIILGIIAAVPASLASTTLSANVGQKLRRTAAAVTRARVDAPVFHHDNGPHTDPGESAIRETRKTALWATFIVVAAAAFLSIAHGLGIWTAARAAGGNAVGYSIFGLSVPGMVALPTVVTANSATMSLAPYTNGACLMYLGQANGSAVFFDPRTEQTVRFSVMSISMVTQHHPCPSD